MYSFLREPKLRSLHILFIWLYVISLFNDLFEVDYGFTLNLHQIIALLYFPATIKELSRNRPLKSILKYFILEWRYLLLLAIIFGIIIPWEYKDEYRTFSQKALGRSFISLIRIFLEYLSIIIPLIWIRHKLITIDKLFKIISFIVIFTVIVAVIDVLIGYKLRLIFPNARLIEGRFMALNGEPRVFGAVMLFGNLLLYYLRTISKSKIYFVAYISTFIGIVLSNSASAIIVLITVSLALNIIFSTFNKIVLLPILIILIVALNVDDTLNYFVKNNYLSKTTVVKIEIVFGKDEKTAIYGKNNFDEPDVFKRFEVFDRAALNYLWNNPLFIFIGTGPNLISIPASAYIDSYAKLIYKDVINSVPHTFVINLLARSGIIGLFTILILFFNDFRKKLINVGLDKEKLLFYKLFFINLMIHTPLFFFILGIIVVIYLKKIDVINRNTHIKLSSVH